MADLLGGHAAEAPVKLHRTNAVTGLSYVWEQASGLCRCFSAADSACLVLTSGGGLACRLWHQRWTEGSTEGLESAWQGNAAWPSPHCMDGAYT